MELGERLRREREKNGWTQVQAAGMLGITNGALSNYERNYREPDVEMLQKFSTIYDISIDYLLGSTQTRGYELTQPGKSSRLPILGTIRAGIPILSEDNFEGELEVPRDIKGDFALQVTGDSMIGAGIHDGDYAICRETSTSGNGDLVAALRDMAAGFCEKTLKYFFHSNGKFVLRAANPDYADIIMDEHYRVGGVVVAIIKKEPPSYRVYREYIATREITLHNWNEVIERAIQCGITPDQVKGIIEMQWQMARQALKGRGSTL